MNTLVRSTTLTFSRRMDYYQVLDQSSKTWQEEIRTRRTTSKRKKEQQQHHHYMMSSRRERAKKRQIFLQSYKLSAIENPANSTSKKLNKAFIKVKSAVVSILSFVRFNSFRSCNGQRAISASSPSPVGKVPQVFPV